MARLARHLEVGERVRCRYNRMNRWLAPLAILLLLPSAVFWGNLLYLQDHPDATLLASLQIPFLIASRAGLVALPFLFLLFWWNRWQAAVTDRRALARRGFLHAEHDEIALAEVADVRHDWDAGNLTLAGTGRELTIHCDGRAAARLLEALNDAYNPRPTLWQRLARMIRRKTG
jgi:hypothetical protein